jgi:hypothetical protein
VERSGVMKCSHRELSGEKADISDDQESLIWQNPLLSHILIIDNKLAQIQIYYSFIYFHSRG